MPIDDELIQRLRALFRVEAEEILQTINQNLLAIEQQPAGPRSQELLADTFRAAHTLKGSARSVDLESVGLLSHHLETLFGQMQRGEQQTSPEVFDLIYESLDGIALLVRANQGEPGPAVDVAGLGERLAAAAAQRIDRSAAGRAPETIPATAEEPAHAMVRYPPATQTLAQNPTSSAEPQGIEPTVRIATAKLDALMAQLNELQVNRISADQRVVEARALMDDIEAWEGDWRKARSAYRRVALATEGEGMAGADLRAIKDLLEFLQANEQRLRLARVQLSDLLRAMRADNFQLAQVAGDLQDDVRRTRMTSVSAVFDAFPRMMRDIAHELNKEVVLEISGAETEVDRSLLELVKAPLLHLLRNAIDHGIEEPAERLRAGKPRGGRIRLAAAPRGGTIMIEVADDGAGIDPARVKAGAVKRGLITPEAAAALSDQDGLWLIFRSGLTTRSLITDLSGRGVGLDVVRENVERLQGIINVESHIGRGSRFTLQLPLTIATTLCLLAEVGGQTFALPVAYMTRLMHVRPGDIGRSQGRQTVQFDGRPVVVDHLADLLGLAHDASPPETGRKFPVIVIGSGERRAAVRVDALLGTQELVAKPLPRPLLRVQNAAGAAILGNGTVAIVLNVADMLRMAGRTAARPAALPAAVKAATTRPVLVIADDSITTRTLEKNILEAAGYDVRVAADGMEAWLLLQSQPCDLLVSDVQMPRLDGFELTQQIRADERLKQLPVILVTALASREDRERGMKTGADAYIVKSAFDQDTLLATIRQLI